MKCKFSVRIAGRFPAILPAVIISSLLLLINTAYADYAEDLKDKTPDFSKVQETSPFFIKPVSKLTIENFYYSDHADRPYCIENSEGRCLDKQNNFFTTIEGNAQYANRFYVYYKSELNEDGRFRLKKGYGLLKFGIWSFEAGKDTVWMGPGYHGSFLLSNNAEGFNLFRLRTDEPFRLPWIFSRIGEFKYDIFRGFADNFSILGQRLSWRPVPLLELGANQAVYIPPSKHYALTEYPKIIFSNSENSGHESTNPFDNDQKVSLDIALDMPFLGKISPFVNGRIYAEYAGNDSYAIWQREDTANMRREPLWKKIRWPFQFDFLNIAWLSGVYLTTGDVDFRFEYAQNYASYPLFYDLYKELGSNRRQGGWYTSLNTNYGMITGHEMGNDSEDYYFEITMRHKPGSLKVYYDFERHDLSQDVTYPPERRYEYGLRPTYQIQNFTFFADLIYNHYINVNYSTNSLSYNIHPGTELDEFIAGLGVEIGF